MRFWEYEYFDKMLMKNSHFSEFKIFADRNKYATIEDTPIILIFCFYMVYMKVIIRILISCCKNLQRIKLTLY